MHSPYLVLGKPQLAASLEHAQYQLMSILLQACACMHSYPKEILHQAMIFIQVTSNTSCCLSEDATPCDDMKHCCPKGYTCNTKTKQCLKEDTSFLYIHRNSSQSDELVPHTVTCPDHVSVCPTGHTCCKYKGHTGYGCCSMSRAVCCEDNEHCCPENSTCDLKKQKCVKMALSVSFMEPPPLKSVICPDGVTACPNGDTCCSLEVKNTYGCCSRPEAVCCSDKRHCCPHGYHCAPDTCAHFIYPTIAKIPLVYQTSPKPKTVCQDGTTVCGMNDTCCKHPDKSWGCCPTTNAVCCTDGHHCCPEKYTCDLNGFTCIPNTVKLNQQLPMFSGKCTEGGSTGYKDTI